MSIKEKRRIILISMIGVIAFVLIMIGISYAYTMFSVSQKNPNVVQAGCLRVTLEEKNNISLSYQFNIYKSNSPFEGILPYSSSASGNGNV